VKGLIKKMEIDEQKKLNDLLIELMGRVAKLRGYL
jgi:hypothetical protein